MRSSLSVTRVGLSMSAFLAVIYGSVMLASLLLVGLLTDGSWQAAFLGFSWSTLIGVEMGSVAIVIAAFALASVYVPAYNFIQRRAMGRSTTPELVIETGWTLVKSWRFKVLLICFGLPVLVFAVLRALATPFGPDMDRGTPQHSGAGLQPVNMGSAINTAYREAEPSFTADGRTMYFNCDNGDICVSHLSGTLEQGSWSPPERLGTPINTAYEEVEPVISASGDKLYFMSRRPGRRLWGIPFLSPFVDIFRVVNTLATAKLGRSWLGGLGFSDVYVSYRSGDAWSGPQNLNDVAGEPPINTAFDDHCLFFSTGGDEAFWTSNRPGGFGDDDIWTSKRVNGKWTQPENLGPAVNGSGSEHSPIPTPDRLSLYVTTERAEGFGGEDIYVTTRSANGEWGPLVNLGPLVNGPQDDRCAAWTPDLKIFLFDSVRAGGFGGRDIWWVYFKEVTGYPVANKSIYRPPIQ